MVSAWTTLSAVLIAAACPCGGRRQRLDVAVGAMPRRGRPGWCQDGRMSVLAIDAGTTGVTAVVVTPEGTIAAKGYQEFAQHFPKPGWVEHSPEEIWQATLEATRAALAEHGRDDLQALGIT